MPQCHVQSLPIVRDRKGTPPWKKRPMELGVPETMVPCGAPLNLEYPDAPNHSFSPLSTLTLVELSVSLVSSQHPCIQSRQEPTAECTRPDRVTLSSPWWKGDDDVLGKSRKSGYQFCSELLMDMVLNDILMSVYFYNRQFLSTQTSER